MARKPDWKTVEQFIELREKHPTLNKSELARLMGKNVRQVRRITNDYVNRVGQLSTD